MRSIGGILCSTSQLKKLGEATLSLEGARHPTLGLGKESHPKLGIWGNFSTPL